MSEYSDKCSQPNDYKYAECNCKECQDRDRYEHVLSEVMADKYWDNQEQGIES